MEWQEPAPARRSWGGLKPQSCWEPALPTLRTAGGSRTLQSWLPPPPPHHITLPVLAWCPHISGVRPPYCDSTSLQ